MAIFLVDLQFREKAKQMMTSRELFAVVLFLLFALLPWVDIINTARNIGTATWDIVGDSGTSSVDSSGPGTCNPHTRACL